MSNLFPVIFPLVVAGAVINQHDMGLWEMHDLLKER